MIVDKLFSCVLNPWKKESQAEDKMYLIWMADWSGEHNTPRYTEYILFSYQQLQKSKQVFELKILSTSFLIAGINSKANNWANSYLL